MNKLFSFFNISNFKDNIIKIISRFPLSVLLIIITSILFFTLNHGNFSSIIEQKILRVIFSIIITFFLSIGVYIFSESNNIKNYIKYLLQFLTIIFGGLFYLEFDGSFENFDNVIFFILTLSGIISFLFFSPYLKHIFLNKNIIFYSYFYNISVIFLTSMIFGGILCLLGNIGIFTVFSLFDIKYIDNSKIIFDWVIFSLVILSPVFALSKIPGEKDFNQDSFKENIFFSFLIKYIAIPFIYIYFIILYAYSIKVLLNFGDWPKGEVSWVVIGFSTFGYIIYIFSYIFENENKFISFFRKTFPYVVIPQIFMLFYAIYLRIYQYDITINRYFVVIFGIWLLIISIYYIFSKIKSLVIIVFILTFFIILISIGPWGVYSLPESRQLQRLENNLVKAGILDIKRIPQTIKKITPLKSFQDIDKNLSKDIYSQINYLCDFNDCESIKNLFSIQYEEFYQEHKKNWEKNQQDIIYKNSSIQKNDQNLENEKSIYNGPSKWEIVEKITQEIKVKSYYGDYEQNTINFNLNKNLFPLDIQGYSKIFVLNSYNKGIVGEESAYIDLKNQTIELSYDKKIIDIKPIFIKLYKLNLDGVNKLDKKDLTFEIDNYKIIFQNITILNPEYNGTDIYTSADGYLLVK